MNQNSTLTPRQSERSNVAGALSLHQSAMAVDAILVEAVGEVDMRTASAFADFLRDAGSRGATVIADLSRVTFFGSVGVESLLDASDPHGAGVRLGIVASRAVHRTLEAAGVTDQFQLYPSVAVARCVVDADHARPSTDEEPTTTTGSLATGLGSVLTRH